MGRRGTEGTRSAAHDIHFPYGEASLPGRRESRFQPRPTHHFTLPRPRHGEPEPPMKAIGATQPCESPASHRWSSASPVGPIGIVAPG